MEMEMEMEADDAQSCAIKGERKMSVQASEVRELIEEMRGNYDYDVDTGERVDLEHGIPQQYEPILSRMEAGGEMTPSMKNGGSSMPIASSAASMTAPMKCSGYSRRQRCAYSKPSRCKRIGTEREMGGAT